LLAEIKRPVQRHFLGSLTALALSLALIAGSAGCTENAGNPLYAAPPTIEAASPASSPPTSQSPAGTVRPLGGRPSVAAFDSGTHQLVVLCPTTDSADSAGIAVFGPAQGQAQPTPRVIPLPGPATALAVDGHGTAYAAAHGAYFEIDLSAGHAARVAVTDAGNVDFTSIARRADGKVVLGSADGAVYTLASKTAAISGGSAAIESRNKIFARVDALVTQGNTTIVLDRGQTSVTTIGADGRAEQALRAGEGATTMAADPLGRVLVADTRGGQLLVYGIDPLILRQAYPVRQAPYGLAGSRNLAWVSQTASNVVIGYDLSTGIPVEKVRYPTVQQPNALAFDEASNTLYVVSGSGAGVQVIEHAAATA
jgi:hypothetical protein